MTIMEKAAVPRIRPPSRTLHFTRQELKEYLERLEIIPIEKITKVFGGLPCRTVKVFPLPDDFVPETVEDFFSDAPGHIVATLAFAENNRRAMFVSFSTEDAVQFALKQCGQSITPTVKWAVNIEVLPDAEFLKFLRALLLEFRFSLYMEKKRSFEHPDARGTTLSADLDIFLSVLRTSLQSEKQKADEEETAKLAAKDGGSKEHEEEYRCTKHMKPNKFEIAYAKKKGEKFDPADYVPENIGPRIKMLREKTIRKKMRDARFARFGYFTLVTVVTAAVGCYIFQRIINKVSAIVEPSNLVQ